jgi:hypothetical protein
MNVDDVFVFFYVGWPPMALGSLGPRQHANFLRLSFL